MSIPTSIIDFRRLQARFDWRAGRATGGTLAIFLLGSSLFRSGRIAIAIGSSASAWQTAHGDPDNTGTMDVPTAPAANPVMTVPGLGGIAPGAAPVIAPDGTLYLGNTRGDLLSFGPNGALRWSVNIGGFQQIRTSPALGSDGSVYVVGEASIRDHTTDSATQRNVFKLRKYTANGGVLWQRAWPGQLWSNPVSGPPNILRIGGSDVVLVASGDPYGARLTAFSGDSGLVLAHQIVTARSTDIIGGPPLKEALCFYVLCSSFSLDLGPPASGPDKVPPVKLPFPAVAIFAPSGEAPLIMMSDGFRDLVDYSFDGSAFAERFRVHDDKR